MTSRAQAIAAAGSRLAQAFADLDDRTPREAAELAHVPGGPSVEAIEARIRGMRGLPPRQHAA